jgi:DNA polymerase elongation subunit (family B)
MCRGQSIKVFSQLLRKARQRGYILPFMKVGGQAAGQDGVAYEGATVLEPKIGGRHEYHCIWLRNEVECLASGAASSTHMLL